MTLKYPKRLIEVDLPIKRISAHARREKSIHHGHISTLHIWWARRPLAACRAVICASLWPDPADPLCPQDFRDRATKIILKFACAAANNKKLGESCDYDTWIKWQAFAKTGGPDSRNEAHWNILRFALLDFIADFSNWDNSTVQEYLETSHELTQAAHEALGGEDGTRPLVFDPFAGGGSIPLEALRVGADVQPAQLTLGLTWSGEVPSQKWMNFYTKVVTKLGAGKDLSLNVKLKCNPQGGVSQQKVEEIKSALRELGLDDSFEE